jgi:hypothetical protein
MLVETAHYLADDPRAFAPARQDAGQKHLVEMGERRRTQDEVGVDNAEHRPVLAQVLPDSRPRTPLCR